VFRLLQMLQEGRLQVRYLNGLHAKMYISDTSVALGSSNFSRAGFQYMLEANVRFAKHEKARCGELRQVAENYWQQGTDFQEEMIALLRQLMHRVSFPEAVARACAEILEGQWAERYLHRFEQVESIRLWPTQREGIARALWILENEGSVLIADATGAGKTRMGVHLLKALNHRLWATGRIRNDLAVLIAPPGVRENWCRERAKAGLNLQVYSDGVLSHSGARSHDPMLHDLRQAQCLAVDEAHHFLNRNTNRTQRMFGNLAEHVVLFTATPINRGLRDILALVDLLGADNLDDDSLRFFDELGKKMRRGSNTLALSPQEREHLQRLLGRFTLRRTKHDLHRAITADPAAFCDDQGKACGYPEHCSHTYRLHETAEDCMLAERIRVIAGSLKGLVQFQGPVVMPKYFRGSPADYVRLRMRMASGLVLYRVMATLRSSRVALVEHLRGTAEACRRFQIPVGFKGDATGDETGRLRRLAGTVYPSKLAEHLPAWLKDERCHREAIEQEIASLEEIDRLVMRISNARELARLELLVELHAKHGNLLAFDSNLISLAWLEYHLRERLPDATVLMASGDRYQEREKVERAFSLQSTQNAIALCSDALSEGVNLQRASCVVLLDMPSVIRIAEQRIGRVDRLNSPHKQVEILWPCDAEAFSLRSDRRFVHLHMDVGALIGANIEVPDEIMGEALISDGVPDTAEAMMQTLERGGGESWEGLSDAFAPVRSLIEGDEAIVPADLYRELRHSTARVHAVISVVKASRPWAFFAVSGITHETSARMVRGWAPRWVFFPDDRAEPITDLNEISDALRTAYREGVRELDPEECEEWIESLLETFAGHLDRSEQLLLPRRKQRALDQMRRVLDGYRHHQDGTLADVAQTLFALFLDQDGREQSVNWQQLADLWLKSLTDVWYEALNRRRGMRRPLRLEDLTPVLNDSPLPAERLQQIRDAVQHMPCASARTVVTILALPEQKEKTPV